ncbi:MAG: hypothetical protein RSA01_03865 [Clostridium sp.]|uniref:hypothetical protein n=1 Tax=Clostridium sp. TaxID=1506 RepID=UPI002FCCAD29
MHKNFGGNTGCSCAPGIRYSLQAIKDCICMCKDSSCFDVVIKITTVSGCVNTITLNPHNLNSLKLCSDSLVFKNDLIIQLEDISKIQVLTSDICNNKFKNCLMSKLSNHNPCCMAMSMDDCHKTGCGNKHNQGKSQPCSPTLTCFLNEHRDDLSTLQFEGACGTPHIVQTIDDIKKTEVVSDAVLSTTSTVVQTNLSLSPENTSVVESVNTTPIDVVSKITTKEQSLVSSVASQTSNALTGITSTPTQVVQSVNFNSPVDVLTSAKLNTSDVCGPLTTESVNVTTSAGVQEVANVATNVQTTPSTVLSGLGTPSTTPVVTGYPAPSTVNAITGYDGSASVIGGVTGVNIVTPTSVAVPNIKSLDLSLGKLQVIIPKNSIGQSLPNRDLTYDVIIGTEGNSVSLLAPTQVNNYVSPNPLLGVEGRPIIETVPTAPIDEPVLNGLGRASTANAVTGYPAATTASVVGQVNSTPVTIPTLVSPSNVQIQSITSPPSVVAAGTSLSTTNASILPVNPQTPVNNTTVSVVGEPTSAPFVNSVTGTPTNVTLIKDISPDKVNSVTSAPKTSVIKNVSLNSKNTCVLDSASLDISEKCVVKDIALDDVCVLSSSPETINGRVIGVCGGIMTVLDVSDDILIYSLCNIVSATSSCNPK